MTKPRRHSKVHIEAAPKFGAACFLCLLLCFGILWPAPLSFAASEPAAAETPKSVEPEPQPEVSTPAPEPPDNVVVAPPAVEPTPTPTPEPEPAPETPAVPDHERAWPIGEDEAAAVVAELWDDGTFVIDGDGKAVGFETVEDVPWLAEGWGDDIKRVIFADKVEAESLAHWFEGCANLAEVANVPKDVKDMTRTFFACPKLVELPDEFELADKAKTEECFGFDDATNAADALLTTIYRGTNDNVLAYAWELDGRELVNPDAPVPPAVDDPEVPETPATPETPETPEVPETPDEDDLLVDEPPLEEATDPAEPAVDPTEPEPEPNPAPASPEPEDTQVNITVPSSVSMMLGAEGDNTAVIPVLAANRSERNVAIVGARLKRASQDLPGGSWSLTTESGSTTFVQDARFTPLGLEATFDRPVVLAAGDESTVLIWHGEFTDYGMKQLVSAAVDAGDNGFAYGSMIWIVAAA